MRLQRQFSVASRSRSVLRGQGHAILEQLRRKTNVKGTLFVVCQRADLKPLERHAADFPYCEFYCKVTVGGLRCQTVSAPMGFLPEWDECFEFPVSHTESHLKVQVEIWERRVFGSDAFIGKGSIENVRPIVGEPRTWYERDVRVWNGTFLAGCLHLQVYYDPFPRIPVYQRRIIGAGLAGTAGVFITIARSVHWGQMGDLGLVAEMRAQTMKNAGVDACLVLGMLSAYTSAVMHFLVAHLPSMSLIRGTAGGGSSVTDPALILRHVEMLGWDIRLRCGALGAKFRRPCKVLCYAFLSTAIFTTVMAVLLQLGVESFKVVASTAGFRLDLMGNVCAIGSLVAALSSDYDVNLESAKFSLERSQPQQSAQNKEVSKALPVVSRLLYLGRHMGRFVASFPVRVGCARRRHPKLREASTQLLLDGA